MNFAETSQYAGQLLLLLNLVWALFFIEIPM